MMVAQPAVAVSTQKLEATVSASSDEERLMRRLLEAVSQRLVESQNAATSQNADAQGVSAAELERLTKQLDLLEQALEAMSDKLQLQGK